MAMGREGYERREFSTLFVPSFVVCSMWVCVCVYSKSTNPHLKKRHFVFVMSSSRSCISNVGALKFPSSRVCFVSVVQYKKVIYLFDLFNLLLYTS